jgi:hypothetical protein
VQPFVCEICGDEAQEHQLASFKGLYIYTQYTCTHIHTNARTHTHTHTNTHEYVCMRLSACVFTCVSAIMLRISSAFLFSFAHKLYFTYKHSSYMYSIDASGAGFLHICIYTCMCIYYICQYIYVYIYIYIYTCIQYIYVSTAAAATTHTDTNMPASPDTLLKKRSSRLAGENSEKFLLFEFTAQIDYSADF